MTEKLCTPDERLRTVAGLVRQGAVFADIGTDHAILPVFLCETGRITRAVAADIAEGPLATARKNIAAHDLGDRIETVLTDGLCGLEDKGLTDIAVCGMGGELIAAILSRAPFVKNGDIRLILQPMSRPAALRRYLAEEGFAIGEEKCVRAAGKTYFCIAASFDGVRRSFSRLEYELGAYNLAQEKPDAAFLSLAQKTFAAQKKKCEGLRAGLRPDAEEENYLAALTELCERQKKEERI